MIYTFLSAVLNPHRVLHRAWKAFPVGTFRTKFEFDLARRPHYLYCVYQAARLAHALGIKRISVVEFGVAGGNGLLELERIVCDVEREVDVKIEIYGFDSGVGLPMPIDFRDIPYIWQEGFFEMDVGGLSARLKRAKLVIGDVKDTAPTFFNGEHSPAPLGAVLADLDYYSSTRDSFCIFDTDHENLLPRIFCYADDVMSSELGILSDDVGQLRAIAEYNELNNEKKIRKVAGLSHSRRIPAKWNDQIYVHHSFKHPWYNTYIHPDSKRQLELK